LFLDPETSSGRQLRYFSAKISKFDQISKKTVKPPIKIGDSIAKLAKNDSYNLNKNKILQNYFVVIFTALESR